MGHRPLLLQPLLLKGLSTDRVDQLQMDDATLLAKIEKNAFLAEGTKKTYLYALGMFMDAFPKGSKTSLYDAVMHPSESSKIVRSFENLNTQKTVMTAILALLKYSQIKAKHKPIFSQWYEVFKPIMRELKKRERNHVATERQKSAILPWEDILRIRDKTLEKGSMEHLLVSMYTMIPPRRQLDYYKVRLYTSPDDKPNRSESFIHLHHPKGSYMLITRFKTDKFFKPFYIKLPSNLEETLEKSLKTHPRDFLFVAADGDAFKVPNSFTHYSNDILKRVFDNPHMTVNILRHASATYINQKEDVTYGERERHAYQMGHSINKQISYEIKTEVEPRAKDLEVGDCYKKDAKTGALKQTRCVTLPSASSTTSAASSRSSKASSKKGKTKNVKASLPTINLTLTPRKKLLAAAKLLRAEMSKKIPA